MPDLRELLEKYCPVEKKHSKGESVWYSNGFPGPFSKRDNSEPACYRYSWLKEEPPIESIGVGLSEKRKSEALLR